VNDGESDALEARYRARSLWLDALAEPLVPRPALAGDRDCDVAIVGAGFTGLWAAYFLARLQPDLRIAVVEREIAGFGPSGRNGGWASAGVAGNAHRYARLRGDDAVRRGERAMADGVTEIGNAIATEAIDCGWLHSGSLMVATSAPQVGRLHEGIARRRSFGVDENDLRLLEPAELERRVRVSGARAASFTPHCGRVDPARLARGLAVACERRGVTIYERTAAETIESGRVRCANGVLRADSVLRATEAFTVQQRGERRRFMPLYSLMVATEPLPAAVWDELGWSGSETVSDLRHLFFYAQRSPDGRIAIGGRGAPYRLGSPLDETYERNDAVRARLVRTIAERFPAAASAAITHHWGGPLGVPRDWCCSVHYDPATGFGWAGGYTGHGVVTSNVLGRTLADLVLKRDSELVSLPWVGHVSPRWEPEPLRFLASRAIVSTLGSADRVEDRRDRPAWRTRLVRPFMQVR
jgi:glycine/D-amino acid oxidase-like deaminating enzyme